MKGILFDIGNVIHPETWDKSASILGLSTNEFKTNFTKDRENYDDLYQKGIISFDAFASFVLKNSNIEITEEKKKLFSKAMTHLWGSPNIEVIKIIKNIKPIIKKAIISNCVPELEILAHSFDNTELGYLPFFGANVYLSHLVGARKPEEKIYLLAVKGLNLKPEDCLFIDDKEKYTLAAQKAGLHGLVYENPSQLEQTLRKYELI